MHPKIRNSGFTIIELMVALVVLGIVMAIGVPSLRDFLVSNRLTGDINSFVGLVNYARSEAITRNQRVVICAKKPGSPNQPCIDTQYWNEYEIQVFVDANGNNNLLVGDTEDVLLKVIPAVDVAGTQTQFVSDSYRIAFNAMGFSQSTARLDIHTVKAGDTAYVYKYGRSLCVSKPGRVRVIPYSASACSSF